MNVENRGVLNTHAAEKTKKIDYITNTNATADV